MSPRRLRSSMNRVAIMAPVGIGDPRRSLGGGDSRRGPSSGAHVRNGGHCVSPNRLVTCRNHDSSEACTGCSR